MAQAKSQKLGHQWTTQSEVSKRKVVDGIKIVKIEYWKVHVFDNYKEVEKLLNIGGKTWGLRF